MVRIRIGTKIGQAEVKRSKMGLTWPYTHPHTLGKVLVAGGTRGLILCSRRSAVRFGSHLGRWLGSLSRTAGWFELMVIGRFAVAGLQTTRVCVAPPDIQRVAPVDTWVVSPPCQAALHQLPVDTWLSEKFLSPRKLSDLEGALALRAHLSFQAGSSCV